MSIPVQFQITNLPAWAYNNEEPATLLQAHRHPRSGALFRGRGFAGNHVAWPLRCGRHLAGPHPSRGGPAQLGAQHRFCWLAGHPSAGESGAGLRESGRGHSHQGGEHPGGPGGCHQDECAGGCPGIQADLRSAVDRQRREVDALAQAALVHQSDSRVPGLALGLCNAPICKLSPGRWPTRANTFC